MSDGPNSGKQGFSVQSFEQDRTLLVTIRVDNLNHFTAQELSKDLRPLLVDRAAAGYRNTVLDVRNVEVIDSSGIALFVSLKNYAESEGMALRICSAKEKMRSVFRIMQLHRFIDLYPNEAAALDACRAPKSPVDGGA